MTLADQVRILPAAPGVYRFRDRSGRVVYLGRATSLRGRVGSYFAESAFTRRGDRRHLLRMMPQVDRIEALQTASVHEAAWLERNLHERSLPRWNRVTGGAEVPQLIVVVDTARRPAISVEHLTSTVRVAGPGERLFGPYLGGLRIRTAVRGLSRVWPLAFTGDTTTGSERDLAAVRGVSVADRARLAAGLVAVLERDPAALARTLAELARRRDEGAAALRFEVAGGLRDEAAAIEWVTEPQRVTTLARPELSLAGWHDGLLIAFTVRSGRLDGWAQRACGAAAAQRHLDATPQPWQAFAEANAELATRLLQAR